MIAQSIHPQFLKVVNEIERDVADVRGYLSSRDIHFLALVAAHPTSPGEILEIGAFRGKSSIVLAKASQLAGQQKIISCDPLIPYFETDNDSVTNRKEIEENLARKNVRDRVEFHQLMSHDLAKTWSRPIRMLWLDGDHSLAGVRQDVTNYLLYLQDGAILAMHDVLSTSEGVGRVFVEGILESPHFGQSGINGNIAWAQFRQNPSDTVSFATHKKMLAKGLKPLIPIQTRAAGHELHGLRKLEFRYLRWRAQSPALTPEHWIKLVA
jgi:predicted O-methyltransferase YrrM